MRQLTQQHHIPLIVDDRLDVALAVEADGLETYEPDQSCTRLVNASGLSASYHITVVYFGISK